MKKICVFDIDGVLNNYPVCWIEFINLKLNKNFNCLNEVKENLSFKKYKELKEDYRLSGYKLNIKVNEKACNKIKQLKKDGYIVIIISSRPIIKYPSLYNLTQEWLIKNDIKFDNLIFSIRKQYDILIQYPEMNFMVEDNRMIANILGKLGYKVYLISNKYNEGELENNVIKIKNFEEIQEGKNAN